LGTNCPRDDELHGEQREEQCSQERSPDRDTARVFLPIEICQVSVDKGWNQCTSSELIDIGRKGRERLPQAHVEISENSIHINHLEVPVKEVADFFRSIPPAEHGFTLI
jgi:hypothetical protein